MSNTFQNPNTQKDIFAHYSSIRVTNSQYKYLVQGEYVEFKLVKSDNEKHEYHAMDITGIMGGPILCETRRQTLSMQSDDKRERSRYSKDRGHNRQSTEAQTSTDDSEDALHASA